jgi:hypothetical protein
MTGQYQKSMECPVCGLRLSYWTDDPAKPYPQRFCKKCKAPMEPSPVDPADATPPEPTGPDVLNVWPPGTPVEFRDSKVPGRVTAVKVQEGCRVQYCIAWWAGNDRKEAWVEGFEIAATQKPPTLKIGFRRED